MLTRRVCASVRSAVPAPHASPAASRSFAALAAAQSPARAPALADITPDGAARFNERKNDFREGLVAAQKQKEQQESQSNSSGHLSVSDTTSPGSPGEASSVFGKALGELTSNIAEEARAREAQDGGKKKSGPLSSLIYGTPEGRELDKDIERSFSQVLARGKYVHSIVFHEVKPDKVDEYTELVGKWYPKVASMPENKVHLVGSWRTEVGDCDTFGIFALPPISHQRQSILTSVLPSAHLGIPAISGLPRLIERHPAPPRIPRVRRKAQEPYLC